LIEEGEHVGKAVKMSETLEGMGHKKRSNIKFQERNKHEKVYDSNCGQGEEWSCLV
jgi:hypothetical protein